MVEMGAISRFFVNAFGARKARRRTDWLSRSVSIPLGLAFLEVGCGNGEMAARLVERFHPARYVATDLDPRQLETARRHLAGRYPGGVPAPLEFQVADMLRLGFPAESFDVAVAITVLHHAGSAHRDFTNVPTALAELNRALRAGGFFLYEEFLHKEPIRDWLSTQGYRILASRNNWSRETVVARKPGGTSG